MKAKKMYKNKNKNTRDKATQPANATRTVYYEELDELKLESVAAGLNGWLSNVVGQPVCHVGTFSRHVGTFSSYVARLVWGPGR